MATVKKMTYTDMLTAVKKIFSVNLNTSETLNDEIHIKSEPEDCFVSGLSEHRGESSRGESSRGTFRGQSRGRSVELRGRGPAGRSSRGRSRGRSGSRSRGRGYSGCFKCGEFDHFARECEIERGNEQGNQYFTTIKDGESKGKEEEVAYITLVERPSPSDDVLSLVHETLACGLVDSGCLKTCAGTSLVEAHKDTLTEEQLKQVVTKKF